MHKSHEMIAKLVTAAFTVRVVVPDDATEEQIIEASKQGFIYAVNAELLDNVYDIDDDTLTFGELKNYKKIK